jgi:hypothetical protein
VLTLTAGRSLLNRTPDPAPVAEDFARDLAERSVNPQMLINPAAADEAATLLYDAVKNLGASPTFRLRGPPAPVEPVADEEPTTRRATAVLDVDWPLRSGAWRYGVEVPLEYSDDAQTWKIAWTPSVLHPRLRDNQSLQLRTVVPQRGPILSSDGDRCSRLARLCPYWCSRAVSRTWTRSCRCSMRPCRTSAAWSWPRESLPLHWLPAGCSGATWNAPATASGCSLS